MGGVNHIMTETTLERIPGLFEIAQSWPGKFIYERTEEPIEKTPRKIGTPLIIAQSEKILENIAESRREDYPEANAYELVDLYRKKAQVSVQFYRIEA